MNFFYKWLLRVFFGVWTADNEEHGDDTTTVVSAHELPPAIISSWNGPLPKPLTVALDYLKREYESGYIQYWITGMDRDGHYYAIKVNPDVAVHKLGDKEDYDHWKSRYSWAGYNPA